MILFLKSIFIIWDRGSGLEGPVEFASITNSKLWVVFWMNLVATGFLFRSSLGRGETAVLEAAVSRIEIEIIIIIIGTVLITKWWLYCFLVNNKNKLVSSEFSQFFTRSLSTKMVFVVDDTFLEQLFFNKKNGSKKVKKLESVSLLTRSNNWHFCTFHERLVVPYRVLFQRFHAT